MLEKNKKIFDNYCVERNKMLDSRCLLLLLSDLASYRQFTSSAK